MAARKSCETGWILREVGGNAGFAVDDPIEGNIFTILLSYADVWESKELAEAAGKRRYLGTPVNAVQVWLQPDRPHSRATAMDFVV